MLPHLHLVADSTIVALSTPAGVGALAVIRLSGRDTFQILSLVFRGQKLSADKANQIVYGYIYDPATGEDVDEVMVACFKAGRSYTKEDSAEISCHGSPLIARQIISLLCVHGAQLAQPGEFTMRAYANGRFDLAQAEAVADLIHAESDAAKRMAMNQMRGGFSQKLSALRTDLIHFASLIELELDFSEEDVEFANRYDLKALLDRLLTTTGQLKDSFSAGNAIKNGLPTVIIGKPNAGKSTLLNQLLQEEKALVSDIPGTTRDVIEDTLHIGGVLFRLIDTAGLRQTDDVVEAMGVERTLQKIAQAEVVVLLFDLQTTTIDELRQQMADYGMQAGRLLLVGNKQELISASQLEKFVEAFPDLLTVSATSGTGIDQLKLRLVQLAESRFSFSSQDVVVSNLRHHQALTEAFNSLQKARNGLDRGLTGDFLALDLKHALYHLGSITGEISTDDLLDNIFSKFCIGK